MENISKIEQNLAELTDLTIFIKEKVVDMDDRLTGVEQGLSGVGQRLIGVEQRLLKVETTMATKEDLKNYATKGDLAAMETRLVTKSYLDNKLSDLGAEIGARINRLSEKERMFKQEMIGVLKRHALADMGEIERLEALV